VNSMLDRGLGIVMAATVAVSALAIAPVTFAQTTPAATDAKAQRQANRKLARDVRKALENASLNVDDVRILAKNGAVTLAGTVPEGDDIAQLPVVASKVAGVTSVANDVGVREEGH